MARALDCTGPSNSFINRASALSPEECCKVEQPDLLPLLWVLRSTRRLGSFSNQENSERSD